LRTHTQCALIRTLSHVITRRVRAIYAQRIGAN